MKVEEMYILNFRQYTAIDWLVKVIHNPRSSDDYEDKIPMMMNDYPYIHLVKVYKVSGGKWYYELPKFEYGRTVHVPNCICEITIDLTSEMIAQLDKPVA